MQIDNIIKELRERKTPFSIHSIISIYKVDIGVAVQVCKSIAKDDNCFNFYLTICPKCSQMIDSGLISKKIMNKDKNCYLCKHRFKLTMNELELVYTFVDI